MESIFDLNSNALATLLSDGNEFGHVFWNIGLYYDDNDWLNRAKFMFEETLKMRKNLE